MSNEKNRNKKKREQKKQDKLIGLANIDFCACGSYGCLKCQGVCRKTHVNPKTGIVECAECYQIDKFTASKKKKSRRTWKYGRQNDAEENQKIKRQRREKRERDLFE